jgi:CO/xanthine dehydrogenase Mo-binding subunit
VSATVELGRRALLRGGALIIGVSLAGAARAQDSHATAGAVNAVGPTRPNPKQIDAWLSVGADNKVRVFLGKVDLGQGNGTTLLQIVAEELDVALPQVSAADVDTLHSMNQGPTISSTSIQVAGPQLRLAAAALRQELLRRAAARLGLPATRLSVTDGVVHGGAAAISYAELVGSEPVAIDLPDSVPLKPASAYTIVGRDLPRLDTPHKIAGDYEFMQQTSVAGMLHGRIVRPRGQGAYGTGARVLAVDEASIAHLPEARIVRRGDFIGVVAPRQWDAVRAARALKVSWDIKPTLPGDADLHAKMLAARTEDTVVLSVGDVDRGVATAAHVVDGTYLGPYQAHGPFSPGCALATPDDDGLLVKCSSQDVFALRESIAGILGLPEARLRVQYLEGSGCYGHACYDDAAIAAALLAQAVGKPVRVQFMRWDEMGWDNFGPAHVGKIRVAADAGGRITAYTYDGWHHGWMVEETSEQLALGKPVHELSKGFGSLIVNPTDVGGMYDIANRRLVNHEVDGLDGYLKGANLRSPMDLSYSFASEQALDALAHALGIDPVEFRRRNISDPRWRGVLDAVAQASNWQPRSAPPAAEGAVVRGRGVALGTHRASRGGAVAEVEVNRETGLVVATHIYAALDCGMAVNPGIVASQISGMATQATSRMLKEEVTFTTTNVTSLDWVSYPVLRFGEHPAVTPIVIARGEPSSGAGEEALAAVGAAIANAVHDATGARLTQYPLTPARVLAALKTGTQAG